LDVRFLDLNDFRFFDDLLFNAFDGYNMRNVNLLYNNLGYISRYCYNTILQNWYLDDPINNLDNFYNFLDYMVNDFLNLSRNYSLNNLLDNNFNCLDLSHNLLDHHRYFDSLRDSHNLAYNCFNWYNLLDINRNFY
jgi:DNA-binding MltR family transcriptional regulator